MTPAKLAPYLKAVVAVLTAVIAAVQTAGGGDKWTPIVTAAIGAILTYLVPNLPAPSTSAPTEETPK
jgi:hypothetical protein